MTRLQRISLHQSSHTGFNQHLGILPKLPVESRVTGRCPCLRDRGLFLAKPGELGRHPKGAHLITGCPVRFELADLGLHGFCGVMVLYQLGPNRPPEQGIR